MDDSKKYNALENILQSINQNYVSLDQKQINSNNKIIEKLLKLLTEKMKKKNMLFDRLFTTIYYGGSYYDGLKISDPGEYDCDLLLELPSYAKPVVTTDTSYPGFVKIFLSDLEKFKKQPEYVKYYTDLPKLLEDDYLCGNKLKQWMESILDKVFNDMRTEKNYCSFEVDDKKYYFKKTKGGPAFTMHVTDTLDSNKFFLDMDLVPCFQFGEAEWPRDNGFRQNTTDISSFFVVPKTPKNCSGYDKPGRYWRLSFQQQEQRIIGKRQSLKPAIKLLKKLRDNEKHVSISSYFIKTIFLWKVDEGDEKFWTENLSNVFMKMLKQYQQHLKEGQIPYFWNKEFNLVRDINPIELENIGNRITKIVKDIDRQFEEHPQVVLNYLVPKDQQQEDGVKQQIKLGKKCGKRAAPDVPDGMVVNGTIPSTGFLLLNNLSTPVAVPDGVLTEASTLNVVNSTSIDESLKRINTQLDLILAEQRTTRALLETIVDRQTNFEDRLQQTRSQNLSSVTDWKEFIEGNFHVGAHRLNL